MGTFPVLSWWVRWLGLINDHDKARFTLITVKTFYYILPIKPWDQFNLIFRVNWASFREVRCYMYIDRLHVIHWPSQNTTDRELMTFVLSIDFKTSGFTQHKNSIQHSGTMQVGYQIIKLIEIICHNKRSAIAVDSNISAKLDVTISTLHRNTWTSFTFIIAIGCTSKIVRIPSYK